MSRYVDIDRLEPQQFENSEVDLGVLAYDYEAVQSEPYIDIVHCKDCIYYTPFDESRPFDCSIGLINAMPTDFCSSGERIEE